jgi:outer membrane immunogenic protein
MKRLLLAAVGVIALIGAAAGADLPPGPPNYYKAPAFVPPPYNWSGFYIGVNGGAGIGRSNWDTAGGFNTFGGLVGGTAGYNYQINRVVLGVEGDVDWSGIRGSTGGNTTSDSWLSTVRGRVGYAADRFMPYITAGGAFGNINASAPGLGGGSATKAGWTVGAGLEFAIAGNWTAKAEYLYADLGRFNCGVGCGAPTDNVSFNANLIRGGVNYRF